MANIVRWNPMREMVAMQNVMDRWFDEAWRGMGVSANALNSVALDVHESEAAYTIKASLPGVRPENINVSLNDDVLTISAEVKHENDQQENGRVLMRERSYGKFARSIRLPMAVQTDGVEAAYENGVLTLTLPKTPETQPRQIPVRGATSSN